MIVLSQAETREVVLTRDRELPPEKQTTFIFGPPSTHAALKIEEMLWMHGAEIGQFFSWLGEAKAGEIAPPEIQARIPLILELIRLVIPATLRDWRNLRDSKGEQIIFESDASQNGLRPELLGMFSLSDKIEMLIPAYAMLQLTEDDVKN